MLLQTTISQLAGWVYHNQLKKEVIRDDVSIIYHLRIERTAAMMTSTADHRAFGGSNKVTYIEIFLMLFNILVVMYY